MKKKQRLEKLIQIAKQNYKQHQKKNKYCRCEICQIKYLIKRGRI